MRKKKKRIILICCVLVFALLVVPFGLSAYIYERIFSERYETPAAQGSEEYDGLLAMRTSFASDDEHMLIGYFYYYEDVAPQGVMIFSHGLGSGGHTPYLPIINYFAQHGYRVFAYDATGNGESGGEDANGFPQGTIDLDYAIDYVEAETSLPIVLFGHSWGAYSCGCVLNEHPEVCAVVSAAGPDDSIDLIAYFGEQHAGKGADVLLPYLSVYEYFKFGKYSNYTCCEGFQNSDCGVMILHSRDDTLVEDEVCCEVYEDEFEDDPRFRFVEYEDRGHSGLFYENGELDETLMEQILSFYDQYIP